MKITNIFTKSKLPPNALVRFLGFGSVACGLISLLMPKQVARTIGVKHSAGLIRLIGVRELISGIGILTRRKPTGWVYGRVLGDAVDLSLMGSAFGKRGVREDKLTVSTAVVAGITLLDLAGALQLSEKPAGEPVHFERSIKVIGSPDALFALWRQPETLPRIMGDFASFEYIDNKRGHWKVPMVVGPALEWEARITDEREGEFLRWESQPGTTVPAHGRVSFRPLEGKKGKTEVILSMCFDPPAGLLGDSILTLGQAIPDQLMKTMLKEFKTLAESNGDLPYSSPHRNLSQTSVTSR